MPHVSVAKKRVFINKCLTMLHNYRYSQVAIYSILRYQMKQCIYEWHKALIGYYIKKANVFGIFYPVL